MTPTFDQSQLAMDADMMARWEAVRAAKDHVISPEQADRVRNLTQRAMALDGLEAGDLGALMAYVQQINNAQAEMYARQSMMDEHERAVEKKLRLKRAEAEATRIFNAEQFPAGDPVVYELSDLLAMEPPGWVWDGLIPEGAAAFLSGGYGLGKTFTVLGLALSMASGMPSYLGQAVTPGRVLYVAGEGAPALRERVHAFMVHNDLDIPHGHFRVEDPKGGVLTDPEYVLPLTERVRAMQPSLVIFDTYGALSGVADENSSAEASYVIRAARSVAAAGAPGCAALFLHHTTKDGKRHMRGSGALTANADTVMVLDPESEEEGSAFSLTTQRSKDGKQRDAEAVTISNLSRVVVHGSCVVQRNSSHVLVQDTAVTRAVRLLSQNLASGEEYDTQHIVGLLTSGLFISDGTARNLITQVVREGSILDNVGRGRYRCTRSALEDLVGD